MKESIKKNILEQQIFEREKNTIFKNKMDFTKKYSNCNIDYTKVYVKIVNYQLKKYGCQLVSKFESIDELKQVNYRARIRNYYKRNRESLQEYAREYRKEKALIMK